MLATKINCQRPTKPLAGGRGLGLGWGNSLFRSQRGSFKWTTSSCSRSAAITVQSRAKSRSQNSSYYFVRSSESGHLPQVLINAVGDYFGPAHQCHVIVLNYQFSNVSYKVVKSIKGKFNYLIKLTQNSTYSFLYLQQKKNAFLSHNYFRQISFIKFSIKIDN